MRKFLLLFIILLMSCESNERIELGVYTKYKGMTMSKNYYNSLMEFKKDKNIDFDSMIVEIKKNYIEPRKQESSTEDCNQIDKSGRYMSKAIQSIKNQGCAISGNQFLNGVYYIQAVCPELGGPVDFEIQINNCGKVISLK